MNRIESEDEFLDLSEKLRAIHKEIVRLIIKKEEYEQMIEEYLNSKMKQTGR